MATTDSNTDVLVIGAGPAGSAASAALVRAGHNVVCLEGGYFPRHVIGESLLPRCNQLLDQVGMLAAVQSRGYMTKPGAVFLRGADRERFSFADGLDGDAPSSFQVPRDDFDQTLAVEARRAGVDLRFGQRVEEVLPGADGLAVSVLDAEIERRYDVQARFVLDCSGYGRVLPRLFDLERPSPLPERVACFSQVEGDARPDGEFEGDIWICVHPVNGWIWIIPFSNGRTSVGMICDAEHWDRLEGHDRDRLFGYLREEPNTARRLSAVEPVFPTRTIRSYSKKVERLHGNGWALAGNAADFLDPVFSSGVTLALESAVLSAGIVDRQLRGLTVSWKDEYDAVMGRAVDVFRAFVESWYRRDLETIFFSPEKPRQTRRRITSVLGGSVLREDNPLVTDPARSLRTLYEAASIPARTGAG